MRIVNSSHLKQWQTETMIEDIFIPKSAADEALVEQLHTVTYVTQDKAGLERALSVGYGLNNSGWIKPTEEEYANLNTYFGFQGNDWETCSFYEHGEGRNILIRVIFNPDETPMVRPEYDGLIVGGATVSFPKTDLYEHEKLMKSAGFNSTIGVKEMEFQSPSGEVYISAEVIYYGPDNCYLLAVKRPDIFVPVGPSDPITGLSGPAYSARCIGDGDKVITFFEDVLGFEIRRDVIFPIGDKSAMLLPEGSEERFIQAFAPGSSTGYLVLMDHMKNNKPSPAPSIGPPSRGIVMWSFKTKNIYDVHDRALKAGVEVLSGPAVFSSPYLAARKTLLMKDPDGFHIEIFEE